MHYVDVFAWCPEDIIGIPRSIAGYELKIPPDVKPFVQKKRNEVKVNSLTSFPFKCFLDTYKGYHHVHIKKTAFHADKGIFCYKKCLKK